MIRTPRRVAPAAPALCAALILMVTQYPASAADLAAGRAGFDRGVKLFIKGYCAECHNPEKKKGKLTLHDINPDMKSGPDVERWQAMLEAIELGDMPPDDAKRQPNDVVKSKVMTWIESELKAAGQSTSVAGDLRDVPQHGNRVDHDALFSGEHKGPAYSPSRLWRISPYISDARYKAGAYKRFGVRPSQPYGLSDAEGIKDYASIWRLDGPTLELLLINANEVVTRQIGPSQVKVDEVDKPYLEKGGHPARKPSNRLLAGHIKEFRAMAYGTKPPTAEEVSKVVSTQCQIAMSRAPSPAERKRYEQLLASSIREGGNMQGTRAVLTAILMAPESIYRMELGLGKKEADGRRMLSPQELAFAVSYAVRDIEPDAKIWADARSGKLLDREVLAGHVRRMIDEEMHGNYRRVQAPRYLRFFNEFFGYDGAPQVFKDGSRHPGYSTPQPERLVADTDALIRHIVKKDKDVLKELLTTEEVAVYTFQKDFRLTYRAYGVPRNEVHAVARSKQGNVSNGRAIYTKPGERVGILTQPAWLMAHSQNFDNDVVIRGKWVYERLLAGVIPDVPIEVDATVPADHDKSLRERMQKTRETYCWKCHRKMDSYGFVFEAFDDVGRYRTQELLRDNKTKVPVVATGAIAASGVAGFDGPVEGVEDLMHKLAGSDRVRQSFVRHVFRYYMGRNETLDDSPTLIAADKAYAESGGSMKELVVSLLTSDSFLYRKDASGN